LEPEPRDPAATARNLHAIFFSAPERAILSVIAPGRPGLVLMGAQDGRSLPGQRVRLGSPDLARFLIEHNDGDWRQDYDEMAEQLATWPVTYLVQSISHLREDFSPCRLTASYTCRGVSKRGASILTPLSVCADAAAN